MSQNFTQALFQGPKDIAMAHRIVKITVYVSLFSAFITGAFAVFGFYQTSSNTELQYLLDPWLLLDFILMLLFTFFLYKRKMWAPICLVAHQALSLVIVYIDLDRLPGVISLLKLALFISATRAVYLINSENKAPIE